VTQKPRVAIVSTHPIQYLAPWFRALACRKDIEFVVLYCHEATPQDQAKSGFGVEFAWNVSLLEGYEYEFLPNVSSKPGLASFLGLDTPDLSRRITKGEFDAVVVNGWHYKSAWQAIAECWRTGTPALARGDSHLKTPRHPLKSTAKWPFYRSFIPQLNSCLPVGIWSRDYFLHYGADPQRIFVVPHVVDSDRISAEACRLKEKRSDLRRKWGLPEEDAVFAFAGKFVEKKRPLDFVRALSQARRMGAHVSGLMIGDGPLRPACAREVLEIKAPILFTGFLNQREILEGYVAADALVLPSDGETWGLVVNEAMVCGRPCFVSDQVGSGPDLIAEGINGAMFPSGNSDWLAGLLRQYADRPRLGAMGQHARESIDRYSPRVAADRLVAAVTNALTRSKKNMQRGAYAN